MRHLDLFSGIGGFALATEMVWDDVEHIFCDIEPFARAVLKKHWPKALIHDDIKKLRGGGLGTVDLLTGGFPCQPFSKAGERRGTADDRHLWPEMLRVIREVSPRWIIGENVDGLTTWNGGMVLENILTDLEGAGYSAQGFVIPAGAVGAPHRRDRVWIVAHADRSGHVHGQPEKHPAKSGKHALSESLSGSPHLADSGGDHVQRGDSQTPKGRKKAGRQAGLRSSADRKDHKEWAAEPAVGRVAHGVPNRVDRIKSLGNAIVPQVAAQIMMAIKQADPTLL